MFAKRHIVMIGRILALLLFVANSGFTLAIHACSMSSTACCADAPPASKAPDARASSSQTTFAASGMLCCSIVLAGGTNAAPVTPAHSSTQHPRLSKVRAELPAISAEAGLRPLDSPKSSLLYPGNTVTPPSVETFILNAVFRI